MDDPHNQFDELPDYSQFSTEEKRKIPTWLWVLGGVFVLCVCCSVVTIGFLTVMGDQIGGTLEEIAGTLEASGLDLTPLPPLPDSQGDPNPPAVQPTVAAGPRSDVDWLFIDDFARSGGWAVGDVVGEANQLEASGEIRDGVYVLTAFAENGIYWTNPTERFDDGIYEVDITAAGGPINNGYGLMFFYTEATDDFYLFEISSDGYAWIGYCGNACAEVDTFVGDGWFETDLIRQGLNATNRLTVEVQEGNMRFLINGEEVAAASDSRLTSGDMGLLVESFDEGGVEVHFDNAAYAPWP